MNISLNIGIQPELSPYEKLRLLLPNPLLSKIEIVVLGVLFVFALIGNLLVIAYLALAINTDKRFLCFNFKIETKKITRMSFYIVSFLIII